MTRLYPRFQRTALPSTKPMVNAPSCSLQAAHRRLQRRRDVEIDGVDRVDEEPLILQRQLTEAVVVVAGDMRVEGARADVVACVRRRELVVDVAHQAFA